MIVALNETIRTEMFCENRGDAINPFGEGIYKPQPVERAIEHRTRLAKASIDEILDSTAKVSSLIFAKCITLVI